MDPVERDLQRLFVAVPLRQEALDFAVRAQSLLPAGRGVRMLGRDQIHVTLAFIGSVGPQQCAAATRVVDAAARVRMGEALIEGFLLLPSKRRPRIVALAVVDETNVLHTLFEAVMNGLEAAGVAKRETRPFRPHVTVARLNVPGRLQPMTDCGRLRFGVESVCLYRSELRREGAKYIPLAEAQLQPPRLRETA